MRIPTIHGYIDRRILINFTADPEIVKDNIPPPFRPRLFKNKAIVGICLIRLKHIKPRGLPNFMGMHSENGATGLQWSGKKMATQNQACLFLVEIPP